MGNSGARLLHLDLLESCMHEPANRDHNICLNVSLIFNHFISSDKDRCDVALFILDFCLANRKVADPT